MRVSVVVSVVVLGLSASFVGLVAFACGEQYKDCYGTDYTACVCADGGFGYAKCSPLGDFQTVACVCDGTTPGIDSGVDAGPPSPACLVDAGDGGTVPFDGGTRTKKFLEDCATSGDCETCLCDTFGTSRRCTVPCTTASDCPAPSDACTSRGVCRPPP
jgi:hypothetical protein